MVNADRLIRLVAAQGTARVRALWSALATWPAKDRRFARLGGLYDGPRVDLQAVGTTFHIRKHGEDRTGRDRQRQLGLIEVFLADLGVRLPLPLAIETIRCP